MWDDTPLPKRLWLTLLSLPTSTRYTHLLIPALLIFEVALLYLVITYIPYTEIDWTTYNAQVRLVLQHNIFHYPLLKGPTGLLVYPAGHVYIYSFLHLLTRAGTSITTAQFIFGALYLLTALTTMQTYRLSHAPFYVFPLLILSRRLHSIYVLRLFNDCWAQLLLSFSILAFQTKRRTWGSLLFSLALSVKMSVLLALPGVAVVLLLDVGVSEALGELVVVGLVQVLLAMPFLHADAMGYLGGAFDFSRVFLYRWTVNWTFLPESIFLSPLFAKALLAVHAVLLLAFLHERFFQPADYLQTAPEPVPAANPRPASERPASSRPPPQRGLLHLPFLLLSALTSDQQAHLSRLVTARYTALTIYTSVTIGVLCARSLHYQFYSWIAWSTPFLLWQTRWPILLQIIVWAVQEYAWNVYPSTGFSAVLVVGCLGAVLGGLWKAPGEQLMGKRGGRVRGVPAVEGETSAGNENSNGARTRIANGAKGDDRSTDNAAAAEAQDIPTPKQPPTSTRPRSRRI